MHCCTENGFSLTDEVAGAGSDGWGIGLLVSDFWDPTRSLGHPSSGDTSTYICTAHTYRCNPLFDHGSAYSYTMHVLLAVFVCVCVCVHVCVFCVCIYACLYTSVCACLCPVGLCLSYLGFCVWVCVCVCVCACMCGSGSVCLPTI